MNTYAEWATRHPQAAADLERMHAATPWPGTEATGTWYPSAHPHHPLLRPLR